MWLCFIAYWITKYQIFQYLKKPHINETQSQNEKQIWNFCEFSSESVRKSSGSKHTHQKNAHICIKRINIMHITSNGYPSYIYTLYNYNASYSRSLSEIYAFTNSAGCRNIHLSSTQLILQIHLKARLERNSSVSQNDNEKLVALIQILFTHQCCCHGGREASPWAWSPNPSSEGWWGW